MYLVHLLGVIILQPAILFLLEIFQSFEFCVELIMPGIEYHNLEGKCATTNQKTDDWQIPRKENHLYY